MLSSNPKPHSKILKLLLIFAGWLAQLQPPSIDGWALELMASRQVLPLLAGILHVPVLYIIGLEQSGNLDSQASAFQAQFSQPLVTGEVLPELQLPLRCSR